MTQLAEAASAEPVVTPGVPRQTVAGPAQVSGVGLHRGEPCTLTFRPAAPGSGVRFRRTDRPGTPEIAAAVANAVASERRTVLGQGDDALDTVEHVLAAVAALGLLLTTGGFTPDLLSLVIGGGAGLAAKQSLESTRKQFRGTP